MTTSKLSRLEKTPDGVWRLEEVLEIVEDLEKVCPPIEAGKPSIPSVDPYPDWTPANTRVVSGPLGLAKFQGTRYATWQEAKREIANRFRVVKFWTFGPRWFARVRTAVNST